ncbi:SusC/RagA family TonB-linked outer membrane protein [Spongiivirga citrea]|uniref:SusC/RagA family TonB-linked outer membrane protein n=1 Tax=Spongiivirga citrea TaxID=1481457 RepID=A0A6M0CJ43_9FLAO|nr:TonB-dependent receptor [Spongiivirga citrea]NER17851.1 SusC/RagA family TonB-linked outer membrane protein [Spongiivirga citrea]
MIKNKFKPVRICITLFLLFFGLILHAQQKTITGKITTKDDGFGLPGVNVVLKGTTIGVSSDFDGNYSIQVEGDNPILVFSYIGFKTQEINVGSNTIINVQLEDDAANLDEVVVIGYGTTKKSDITGSVSSVKSEELSAFPVLSTEQALQGRAAGVAVQSNNGGEPGAPINIRIRGNTSIGASSAALVVVDGFIGGSIPQPNDVASIEVLKDASATAIYGSRGANGVILVTTKKGTKGKMQIELNSSYAIQNITETLDLLNANQFANYRQQINPAYTQGPVDTDWQDLIYRTGSVSNHQLSFSGGSDKINYYVSGNYFKQDGIVINSDFERFSFLGNIDIQATDRLKLGFNSFANRGNKNGVQSQASSGGSGGGDVISTAYRFAPDQPIQDANGVNTTNPVGDEFDNPVAIARESVDDTTTDDYRANFYADYELIDGLSFKTTFGFSTVNRTRGRFLPSTLIGQASGQGGIASIESLKGTDILSENYLTYNKDFDKHSLTALLGYSYQKTRRERYSAESQNFISNSVSYFNLAAGSNVQTPVSNLTESEIVSQFARVNYEYDDRYLLTLTARRDGASNFAKNNKYAFFPSGAIGWNISNEEFLSESNTISNLKLRASYGVTGNPSINPYQSLASLDAIYAAVGDQTVNAVVPQQLANPDLKWESSYQTNIGVDFGFFDNRLTTTLDYYNIDTKDLILGDSGAPEYIGFSRLESLRNVGEINNKGFEITISSLNVANDNFTWSTDLNWATNKVEVVKLINGEDIFLDSAPGSFLQDQTHILREGEAVGVFWGYEYQGVYQGGAVPAGQGTYEGAEAGDELFTDLDGDGIITGDDRKIIGDPNQDWTFGLNNTFTYKNFDLNIFFQGAIGGDIFSYTFLELASGESNATTEVLNAWTPANTNTNVPSAKVREKRINSRFVYDGSYVRLKNLALGYNLPTDVIGKFGLQGLRVSLSGQNLLTFTDFPGTDPEASYQSQGNQNNNVNLGFDYGSYPNIRSYTLSLNLKF